MMEWAFDSVSFYIIIILLPFITLFFLLPGSKPGLPPGPRGWPLFGYMFSLGSMPHRSLAALKQQYGPVILLKLGSKSTMVILNTRAATELFKNHDLDFADRTITEVLRSSDYNKSSMAFSPHGMYWRVLRRLVTVEMLVNKRLNESAAIREKGVRDMLSWIRKEHDAGEAKGKGIHVAHFVFFATFNIMGNLILSSDHLMDPQSEVASDVYTSIMRIVEIGGTPNVSDFFPWLKWLDIQRLKRRMDCAMAKALEICSIYVEERLKERLQEGGRRRNDFLEVLLDYEGNGQEEPAKLSKQDVSVFILDIFMAGTETNSSTVEWALTELLCNPETMIKARVELAKVVGANRSVQESDIDNLPYLQAVVKETLRLHPPIPLLLPRRAMKENINFMGYKIPKNTQVFVNAWAIGRDPECWDEPLSFKPERFLVPGSTTGDYKGQHFEMIPFGGGRRNCPGIPLAQRMVPLILGSLIHEFQWELEKNVTGETMDMREKMGLAVTKLEPLRAIPKRIKE